MTLDESARYLSHLADYPEWRDHREGWRNVGMALQHEHGRTPEAFEIWRAFSETSPYYDIRELKKDWRSFRNDEANPITMRTIIDAARGEYALLKWEMVAILDEMDADRPDEPKADSHLTFRRPDEIGDGESRRQIVKGLIAAADVGCIIGAPGVGKSLLAPFLGYGVAQGRDIFGLRVRQGLTFYVAAEDQFGMGQRVRALRRQHGEADDFRLVGGVSDLLSKGSKDLKALKAAVEDQRPAIVFIDTLAMAFPGLEENSAEGMGRVVAVARSLTKWGAAVVLIHHDTKDGQQGLPRGHSLLNGALDVSLMLKRGDDGIVRGRLTKNRNGSCDLDIAFRIETEALGEDEDGDPITAAYADPLDGGSYATRAKVSPQARAALTIAEEMAGQSPTLDLDAWRDRCLEEGGVSDSESPDARKRGFNRARRDLIDKHRIRVDGETVTLLDRATGIEPDDFDGE